MCIRDRVYGEHHVPVLVRRGAVAVDHSHVRLFVAMELEHFLIVHIGHHVAVGEEHILLVGVLQKPVDTGQGGDLPLGAGGLGPEGGQQVQALPLPGQVPGCLLYTSRCV